MKSLTEGLLFIIKNSFKEPPERAVLFIFRLLIQEDLLKGINLKMNKTETIAAISTAMNSAGIGIVRISGDEAFDIIKKIFRPMKKKDISAVPSHTVHYGNIVDGDEVVDEVLVLIMKAPHTYTREDTVEIDCHGGMYVLNRTLDLVIKNGARPANPGEFTQRAFLNGRIDLSQAEAVIDIINAENDYALKSAVGQLKGSVSEKIKSLRERILEQTAYIEAALDDPEHYEMEGYGETLYPVLEDCLKEIDALIDSSEDGRILKEGIKTVILGKPNAGKSSFLNAILGEERAIVTDIAGTTRDILEESVRLKDITLNIVDTAGIRKTEDVIEKMGVDKAKEYAKDADLIVFIADTSVPLDSSDYEIIDLIQGKKTITLLNKRDLEQKCDTEKLKALINGPFIDCSIKEGRGIEEFEETVRQMFYQKDISFNDQVYITNARQKAALVSAKESLKSAMESIKAGMSEDFYTIDLMDAYSSLGEIIGESVEDDLADEIFSKFCMGK